jgi:hypothetical protein
MISSETNRSPNLLSSLQHERGIPRDYAAFGGFAQMVVF